MEDNEEPNFFNFSDELVTKSATIKVKNELPLEEWICRLNRSFLSHGVASKSTIPKKIEKYLSYDWNNPSDAAKEALEKQLDVNNVHHPLEAIAIHKDPTGGKLLRLCLDKLSIPLKGKQI